MKKLVTAVAALFAVSPAAAQDIAPPRCEYGEMHENAPPETAQSAFLIGDYKIHLHK